MIFFSFYINGFQLSSCWRHKLYNMLVGRNRQVLGRINVEKEVYNLIHYMVEFSVPPTKIALAT